MDRTGVSNNTSQKLKKCLTTISVRSFHMVTPYLCCGDSHLSKLAQGVLLHIPQGPEPKLVHQLGLEAEQAAEVPL